MWSRNFSPSLLYHWRNFGDDVQHCSFCFSLSILGTHHTQTLWWCSVSATISRKHVREICGNNLDNSDIVNWRFSWLLLLLSRHSGRALWSSLCNFVWSSFNCLTNCCNFASLFTIGPQMQHKCWRILAAVIYFESKNPITIQSATVAGFSIKHFILHRHNMIHHKRVWNGHIWEKVNYLISGASLHMITKLPWPPCVIAPYFLKVPCNFYMFNNKCVLTTFSECVELLWSLMRLHCSPREYAVSYTTCF